MAKKDKSFAAVQTIHAALSPLKPDERSRVLASVTALLEVSVGQQATKPLGAIAVSGAGAGGPSRPLAIRELIQDKHPKTHPQFITLFAYYREKYQNLPNFSRDMLQRYYTDSCETPPGNYDRDFVTAISKGWIHEDGENSYITSKGIEAVETGFSREADPASSAGKSKKKIGTKKQSAKKPGKR